MRMNPFDPDSDFMMHTLPSSHVAEDEMKARSVRANLLKVPRRAAAERPGQTQAAGSRAQDAGQHPDGTRFGEKRHEAEAGK